MGLLDQLLMLIGNRSILRPYSVTPIDRATGSVTSIDGASRNPKTLINLYNDRAPQLVTYTNGVSRHPKTSLGHYTDKVT